MTAEESVATIEERVAARAPSGGAPRVRELGLIDYRDAYDAMRRFTDARDAATPDELWLLEHPPVYTVGPGGRSEHLPRTRDAADASIALERVDRGGQITYHGPGQAIVYVLLDLRRRGLQVRPLVRLLEQAVIDVLARHGIRAARKPDAPGVYVDGAKIAALGLRVRRGCSYHGVALNAAMDLGPFAAIDPCGYSGLAVTQAADLGIAAGAAELGSVLAQRIARLLEDAA
jgi:lipoyl(octanoyl) transferase